MNSNKLSSLFGVIFILSFLNITSLNAQCASTGNLPWNTWIGAVTVGGTKFIQPVNSEKGTSSTQNDFTANSAAAFTVNRTQTTALTIEAFGPTNFYANAGILYYTAWIDFDGSGTFDDSEKVIDNVALDLGISA